MIPVNAKLPIYKATTVLPNQTYCYTIRHFCRKSDEKKLEKLQERALHIVFNSKSFTYDGLLKKSNLSTKRSRHGLVG